MQLLALCYFNVMLNVIMLNVIMLNVIMLSVIMLSVVAQNKQQVCELTRAAYLFYINEQVL